MYLGKLEINGKDPNPLHPLTVHITASTYVDYQSAMPFSKEFSDR